MDPLSFKISVGSAFLLICIIIHFPFSTACLQDERSYLLDFKGGLNLSSASTLSSWRGFNCCEWAGVACDYHTSHVIRLDLSNVFHEDGWDRRRQLRPSLFDLQHLQHLDLSSGYFSGISIPFQLFKLQKLTFLSLSKGGFCGEVPLELGNMSSLCHLDISYNYLEDCELKSSKFDVWVRNLRSLEFLRMAGVNLTMASEQWGEALNGLTNLTQIHLSYCFLSGKIPDLSNLTHLSHLDMSSNSFPFELPSWFENVTSLVSLDLSYCGLNGSIPSNFMARSRMSNLVLGHNNDLKGNLSFILSHSTSLVVLSLPWCNLGALVPSISNFSKLETMDLSYNNLDGSISSFLGNFSSLKRINLDRNNLEGTIPSSLGSCLSLKYMYLSYNRLSGPIPQSLSQIPTLRMLALDHNQLSGTIPDSVSNLTSLEEMLISSNRLTGNFSLQLLENVTCIEILNLSENELLVNIPKSWVPQFSRLLFLGLGSCNIEGDLPAFLSQQFLLELLDLPDNKIVGNLPLWLWDLPNLQYLNLSNNQLEGCCLPRKVSHNFTMVDLHGNRLYGSLPALDFVSDILDISDNEFNGSIPARVGTSYSLSLSGNNLTGQIPSSICSGPYSLDVLDLSKNKLIGMIPANIGRCSGLSVLKLAQNILQGKIPKELGNLTALHTLNLNGNKLQGIIPSFIANCKHLQVFDLGNNKFEGNIPVWVNDLTDLRILSLGSNKFIDRIPPQLFRMQNLQIIDLSGNQLSGSIPPDVTKLYAMLNNSQSFDVQHYEDHCSSYFTASNCEFNFADEVTVWIKGREASYEKIIKAHKFMDLSRNQLSGNIPPELGLLKGLISLNISKNNLSGSIPESLGAMAYLESLDLSKNILSGKIPSQLLNLTFLAVLNLSDNMLFGLIPQGKQFSTFEASSFLGNPNLYGPQLENMTLPSGLDGRENHNNTVARDGDGDVMDQWWAVGLGLSYGLGFATVIAVLCFHMKWRYICFSHMDSFIYYLLER
ncbi:receptor-like protein EIX2 [Cryptomeria japonica]|uniref:receptor-like protein EIX2 n=1 Tax=Cryptomeria japonica TaxID=3369 RepID=UPI0027DA9C39|nr:receptor-like protein EIX2 [Cryptomeria japonica]